MTMEVLALPNVGVDARPQPIRGYMVKPPWAWSSLTFPLVFGPSLIGMEADHDAGAVSTYIQSGAQSGRSMHLQAAEITTLLTEPDGTHPGIGRPPSVRRPAS